MRISDWSSDLCSSDLETTAATLAAAMDRELASPITVSPGADVLVPFVPGRRDERLLSGRDTATKAEGAIINDIRAGEAVSHLEAAIAGADGGSGGGAGSGVDLRSAEQTYDLQSLMRRTSTTL